MSKLKFKTGAFLDAELIEKTNIYSKGQSRDALEIHIKTQDKIFDDLITMAQNPNNLGTLTIEDNGEEFAYPNYEIFHSLVFSNDEYILTIAQLTEQEIKYNELLRRIEALER